jgi:hypothetical protein
MPQQPTGLFDVHNDDDQGHDNMDHSTMPVQRRRFGGTRRVPLRVLFAFAPTGGVIFGLEAAG